MSNRKDWKLGASSIVVTDIYGLTDYALSLYQQAGVEYLELSLSRGYFDYFNFVENAQTVLSMTEKYGLKIWSLHLPFDGGHHTAKHDKSEAEIYINKAIQQIAAGLSIGIKTFVIHPSWEPVAPEKREKMLQATIENLRVLSKYAQEHGGVLAVENLPRSCLCNCSEEMIRVLNAVPHLQTCFDTNHCLMQTSEAYLEELLKAGMKGKIRTIHVSDYDFVNERHWLPKAGVNDWEKIFQKLEELDYTGVFMYELSKPNDKSFFYTLEEIKENFKALIG